MSYFDTILKELAIDAVLACGGDLSIRTLRTLGLSSNEAVTLGKILEEMGAAERVGPRQRRMLAWSPADVVETLELMADDYIERPEVEEPVETTESYTIVHDPHDLLPVGETFTRTYLKSLLDTCCDAADGLELECAGKRFRIYQGVMYTLARNGRMIPPG